VEEVAEAAALTELEHGGSEAEVSSPARLDEPCVCPVGPSDAAQWGSDTLHKKGAFECVDQNTR
jgi:hypothetical protein